MTTDFRRDALDDLTWELMHGKTIKAGFRKLTLWDVLLDAEHHDLVQIIMADMAEFTDLKDSVERIVRERIKDSIWHEARIEYLTEGEDE